MDVEGVLTFIQDNLIYNRDTGDFFWASDRSNGKVKAGSLAGSKTLKGYRQIRIGGKWYKCHRLVWLMETGNWPNGQIDHINRNGLDNRFGNLREVNNYQNCTNRGRISKSGVLGVYYDKKNKKWITGSYLDGTYRNLGRYPTREEASKVYKEFNKERS
jgi:hypothetical protein